MYILGRVGVNHPCGSGFSAEHSGKGGAIEIITGRLTARGMALDEDTETLLLGNANPGLHKVASRYLALAHSLQALVHRASIDHQDVLLLDETLEHLECGEMGSIERADGDWCVLELLRLIDTAV